MRVALRGWDAKRLLYLPWAVFMSAVIGCMMAMEVIIMVKMLMPLPLIHIMKPKQAARQGRRRADSALVTAARSAARRILLRKRGADAGVCTHRERGKGRRENYRNGKATPQARHNGDRESTRMRTRHHKLLRGRSGELSRFLQWARGLCQALLGAVRAASPRRALTRPGREDA